MSAIGFCDKCGEDNWESAEAPFERARCKPCGYLPVATMPGPQTDFVLSRAAHPAFLGGRGSAKTAGGILKMWTYVHNHPGANGAISFPTFTDVDRIFLPELRKFFGELEGDEWVYQEKKKILVFPHLNCRAFILSAEEPGQGKGLNLAWFWMEEVGVGSGHKLLFFNLQPALRQFGDDYDDYQGWLTSTPNVQFPWLKQLYQDGISPVTEEVIEDPEEYPIFPARTIDNPCLPKKRLRLLLSLWGDSRMARQELEGQFISVEGIVFPELKEDVHLRHPPPDHEFIATVGGLDFGDASPTALLELKMDRSRKIWITREFYKRNATDDDWIKAAAEWNLPLILCDPSASEKDLMTWRMRYNVNLQAAMAARDRAERGRLWRTRLAVREDGFPGLYISTACPHTWNELLNLAHYVPKGQEEPQKSVFAPGTNDHSYDAGAYGMSYFERGYIGRPQKTIELVKA
ncbi:hypothetical protein LCGC14_1046110 [marine sediment metagenome]|uniref:Phage terminase large subunit N-terminal domain-containing protein n=1 Tax=marine sediment metagenome TaxID=412755 RepID=A0A0F9MUP8_9ZZZZ